ncbi:MAG TPA: family 20 glycosylhydrolase, partial [Armatimonadota bacterium]
DRDFAWLPDDLPTLAPQGYQIRITPEQVLLMGADAPGLFYAVQTFGQLLDQVGKNLPTLTITDAPVYPVRGVMLDVSRGKVPTVDTVLEIVAHLASWKINQFQLYIEHTFLWPSHPDIGKKYDALTPEDLLTIDAACADRHIDFVPNLQSFGHQGHLLQMKQYAHLAETDARWTLSPAEPGTYTLLDEFYQEFLPNFRSPLFNIDSDETWDLGKGKSLPMVEEKGLGRVYLEHILRVRELAARYGRRIMFWGDIILHSPELIPDIPDDTIVLQWDYAEYPNEAHVRQFADAGKAFYVCPGVSTWSAFFPRQQQARGNISRLAQLGVQYGACGLLNTDWGDGGHYNLQGLSYYGYAFGAAESWRPGSTEGFDQTFGRLFYGPDGAAVMDAMRALERVERPLPETTVMDVPTFHMGFLQGPPYRDTLTQEAVEAMLTGAGHGVALLKRQQGRTRQPLVIEELLIAAQQDLLSAEKAALAVPFHRQYTVVQADNDLGALSALVRETGHQLRRLAKKAASVPERFAPLWLARAREAGLADVLEYQLEVPNELEASAEWLRHALRTAKRTGLVPALPERDDNWRPKVAKIQQG